MKEVGIIKHLIRNKDGSITLEAAMILPIFMIFIMFLIMFIKLAVADMALYEATSDTTEIVSSYAYPGEIMKSSKSKILEDKLRSTDLYRDRNNAITLSQVVDWTDDALKFFGIDVAGAADDLMHSLIQEDVIEPVVQDYFKEATGNWSIFSPDNLTVKNVSLEKGEKFLQIDVEYNLDFSLPFFDETVTLKKTSYERLWTGKTGEKR